MKEAAAKAPPKPAVVSLAQLLTEQPAAGKDRAGFTIPAARRVLVCQFEPPTPQFVARLASMRRSVGAAADQNLEAGFTGGVPV